MVFSLPCYFPGNHCIVLLLVYQLACSEAPGYGERFHEPFSILAQELNIDDVDKTMDEISEAQDQMQQMNDVLSQPIGTAADLDEDELAAELAVSFLPFCMSLHILPILSPLPMKTIMPCNSIIAALAHPARH